MVIANQCHLKLKANKEANLITNEALSEAHGASKIRELYWVIWDVQEKTSGEELRQTQEIETEWELLGASKKVNSADQIDQLNALRLKTQMERKNLSREKSMKFWKTKCMVRRKEFRRKKPITNMATPLRKLKWAHLENMGHFPNSSSGIPDGDSLIEGRFAYAVGNKPISAP